MTSAFVASVVRTVLAERELPDALVRVAALPFSWEVTLRNPSGVEWRLMVPDGSSREFAEVVRGVFAGPDGPQPFNG